MEGRRKVATTMAEFCRRQCREPFLPEPRMDAALVMAKMRSRIMMMETANVGTRLATDGFEISGIAGRARFSSLCAIAPCVRSAREDRIKQRVSHAGQT